VHSKRLECIDLGRGIALIAMTIFHFAFDLELLGLQEPGFISQPHWKYFARCIASSFLFLTGVSLYLAHQDGVSWDKWRWRMAKIAGAALVITVATYFATPTQYIFFGILHQIAFASLVGLVFVRLPIAIVLGTAIIVFVIGQFWTTPILNHPMWWWSGLSEVRPNSSDYVPVFPWFSAPLIGIALASFAQRVGWLEKLSQYQFDGRLGSSIKFLGRNSLVYYLLHQPIMIALLLAALFVTGNLQF
jgi:uncharacterized membrane protein